MRKLNLLLSAAALLALSGLTGAGDDAKDKAIKKDRQLYDGAWRVVALDIDGNKWGEDDARKISVINKKDGTWTILMDGSEVAKGTSTIDPTKKPKTINFTPDMGLEAGKEYLGIYEIEAKKRRLCFAKPGTNRPTEFASAPGSDHFLVSFEREKADK